MKMPFRFVEQYQGTLIDQFDEASHSQQNDGMPRTQLLEEAPRARLETHVALFVKQRRDICLCKEIVFFQGPDVCALAFR